MSSIPLIEFSQKISGTVFVATCVINYVLIYLTLFHANNLFGTYRHLIVTFAVFGIVYSCAEFVTRPIIHLNNSSLVLFSLESPLRASNFVTTIMLASFAGLHCSILSVLSIQFLYRYWSMFDCSHLRLFKQHRITFWILGVILGGILWTAFSFYVIPCDSFSRTYLRTEFWEKYRVDTSYISCISLIFVDRTSLKKPEIRWNGVLFLSVLIVVLTSKLIVMIYCGLRMAARVNKRTTFRSSKHHNQRVLFVRNLIVQLAAPICIVYLPTIFISCAPLLNIVVSVPNWMLTSLFTIYPAIDGVISLFVIVDYRNAFKKLYLRSITLLRNTQNDEVPPITIKLDQFDIIS